MSRTGPFRTTVRPIRDRIREGRKVHREDELPKPRATAMPSKEARRLIGRAVATRLGAACGFSYACRHGTRCRGIHSEDENLLFRKRERKVAALEREAGCVYCRAGICAYKTCCRGQTAMRQATKTDRAELPAPRKPIRKRGRRRPRGKKLRSRGTRSSAAANPHGCDPQGCDSATPPETRLTPTSDLRQPPMARGVCHPDRDQKKGIAITEIGCDDLASDTPQMLNDLRVSELAADIQGPEAGLKAGGHATGARQQAAGEEHRQEAQEEHQHQHQQPFKEGHQRKDNVNGGEDGSRSDGSQASDQGSDQESDSYSSSDLDSRQCCADLQMMIHVPETLGEMIRQRRCKLSCEQEGTVLFQGLWFCTEHTPRPEAQRHNPDPDSPWECNSEGCDQPGFAMHSGLWFCREHAWLKRVNERSMLQKVVHWVWEQLALLGADWDTIEEITGGIRRVLFGMVMILWWLGTHWGWTAALLAGAGWTKMQRNLQERKHRLQGEQRYKLQEEQRRVHQVEEREELRAYKTHPMTHASQELAWMRGDY